MEEQLAPVSTELRKLWSLLQEPIFQLNNSKISITSLTLSVLVIILTTFVARVLGRAINRTLKNKEVDSGVRDSVEKFSRYLIIAVGVLFSLDNLGISISSLAAVGAVLMVGIGFGLQNITQNFISGIILLIERPIKVGDIIRVGNSSGRVIDIRVRSSIIQTRDDVTIIVPNSKFLAEEVISDSFSGQKIRQHVKVSVAYGSDVQKVKDLLCQAAMGHPKIIKDMPPKALFQNFGESTLDFDLRFWCSDLWDQDPVSSDVRTEIERLFREAKIEIPFPQRDLHIKGDREVLRTL